MCDYLYATCITNLNAIKSILFLSFPTLRKEQTARLVRRSESIVLPRFCGTIVCFVHVFQVFGLYLNFTLNEGNISTLERNNRYAAACSGTVNFNFIVSVIGRDEAPALCAVNYTPRNLVKCSF